MDLEKGGKKEMAEDESAVPFLFQNQSPLLDKSVSAPKVFIVEPLLLSSSEKHLENGKLDVIPLEEITKSIRKESILSSRNRDLGWQRYLGLIYTLLSTNCFSLASVVLKMYSHIHPFNLGTWAFPLAAILSIPFIVYTIKVEKKSVIDSFWPIGKNKKVAFFIWFRSIVSCMITYALILSFKYITVADTRTIMAASVITVYFLGWLFLGEQCGIVPTIVAIMAICGIGVMTRPPILTGAEAFNDNTLIGVALAVLCLILATIIIVTLRFLQNVHHGVLNCFLYTWAAGQSMILAFAFDKFEVPASIGDVFALGCIGTLMVFGNTFLVLALQAEEAGVVALIRTSEVIFTFFWQFVFIGVRPDSISVLGAALVLTGVVVVTLRKWVASLPSENQYRKRFGFLLR